MNEKSRQDANDLEQMVSMWETNSARYKHLSLAISTAVPIRILGLLKRGGPEAEDFDRVHTSVKDLVEHGTDLFFRSDKEGATANRFEQVVDAIAVLSFCPGGITIFGEHYQGPEVHKQQEQ